jgi:hypothetical protein
MIKFNAPKNYSLYESAYGSDSPFQQLYLILFDTLPSKFSSKINYDISVVDFFKTNGFIELIRNENSKKYTWLGNENNFISDSNEEKIFVNYEKQIAIMVSIKKDEKIQYVTVIFLYNLLNGDIKSQIDFESIVKLERKKKKSSINLIKSDMGHLDIEEYDLIVPDVDLKLNYGESFIKVHDLVVRRLNTKSDKGIILLHGDPGTGKTSYIKYLTKLVNDKEILFIPPSMAEMLSEPSIIPFLMEHKNSILIIEDAERVISDREINGSSAGVSNILNLTDGILGDCLNIQIIATFNMKKDKIDQALLRKGRLIVEHKFTNLSVDDTNNLLKSLGKDYVSDKGMCLADIYNVDIEYYKTTTTTPNKIGF